MTWLMTLYGWTNLAPLAAVATLPLAMLFGHLIA
jgi:hypothetical protein